MSPKPLVTRAGKSGRLRHQATRLKSLAVVGALTLGCAGAALVAAGPASADAAPQYVSVGSDTTENMMDAFAALAGDGTLGSYDAVNPLTQVAGETITPGVALPGGQQELCSYTRPNGSTQGFESLDFSANPNTTLTTGLATNPQPSCISASRSSSTPGSVNTTAGDPGSSETSAPFGNFVYIPFAVDAVTWATGPVAQTSETTLCDGPDTPTGYTCSSTTGTGTVSFTSAGTNISQDLNLSQAELKTLYGSCESLTVGTTTLNPTAGVFNFSATSASPAVFTASGSAYTAGTAVVLSGPSGALPGGFTAGTTYYVVSPSTDTFELAATSGGTAINSTSTGYGTVAIPGAVDLYVPQNGSGTLKFWETEMGVTAVQSCWHQTVAAGPATGLSTEEHDGTAIASDPNGIFPNSIAKWLGMNSGVIVPDVRHGSVLQSVVAPGIAFTATMASPAVFTAAGSSYTNGTEVQLTGSSLPAPFAASTDYFIVGASGDTFELAATSGGTAINSTSSGSGDVNITVPAVNSGGTMNVAKCLTGGAATSPNFNQGLCFPLTREVYNVVDWYEVNNTAPTLQSASPAGPAYSFTATDANPAVFTATGSDYANGQLVTLVGTSLPGGFAAGTNYYACNTTTNTFELCSTPEPGTLSPSSAPLASSSTGSGGVSDNPAYSPVLAGLLTGTSSSLCTSSFTIEQLGFGTLPSANSLFADLCGATTSSLRVQMNNTSAAG